MGSDKSRVIGFRVSIEEYNTLKSRYGEKLSDMAKRLLQSGGIDPNLYAYRLRKIRENQKAMAALSNENKKMWKEIREELGIE